LRLVLFDVDGTLVNVQGAGRWSLTRAFEVTFGTLDLDRAAAGVRFDGRTDPVIIAEIAACAGISREDLSVRKLDLEECYLTQLERRLREIGKIGPLPGVVPILDSLGRRGMPAGLLTGNTRSGAMMKLRAAALDEYFSDGAFGSDGEDRAALGRLARERFARRLGRGIGREEVVVVGDAPEDVRAARANGYRSLAVGTGWTSLAALRAEAPDLVLTDLADTESVLAWIARASKDPAGQGIS